MSCLALAYDKLLQDPVLTEMAAKQQATVAQAMLIFLPPPLGENWDGGQQR